LNPLKQLFGQTAIYGMGTIVPRLLNYLLVPLYTRIFTDDQYGIITELYAYVAFLLVLLTYGMETSFFRHAEKEKDGRKVFSTSLFSLLVTSLLFVIVLSLFLDPIASLMRYESNSEYILLFGIIVALDAVSAIPFAYLRQQNRAVRFSIIKIINVSVNIGLNLFFLVLCPKVLAGNPDSILRNFYDPSIGIGYVFISNLVASVVTLILLVPQILSIELRVDLKLLKRMLYYGLPLLVVGIAGMINEVSDKIIFKYLVTVPEGIENAEEYVMGQLGIYGANYKLAVLMTLFIQMFRYAAEPFFFAHADEKNSRDTYAQVMKYFVIFGLAIFLLVTLFIDVFKYFIGPDYWDGLLIVPIILLANLFLGIFYNLSVWYKLNDITIYGAYIGLAGAAVTILLNVILVPVYGYTGAAWAHFFTYLFILVVSFFLGRRFFRIDYPIGRIGFYFLIAMAIFGFNSFINFTSQTLQLTINALFLMFFIFLAIYIERKELKAMRH